MEHGSFSNYCQGCRCDECRAANAAYFRRYRQTHKEYISRNRKYRLEHKDETHRYYLTRRDKVLGRQKRANLWFRATIDLWRRTQGCADCGRRDGMLHYHHVDPTLKRVNVSTMGVASLETLYDEIDKCVVLCARCHYWRHRRLREEKACQASLVST